MKWPVQYPGQWKGTIMGSSDALGNDASHSNAVPIYMVAVQGSPFNAWLFPDPQDAARILGANVNVVTNISSINTFVNEPFKYTPGDEQPAGRQTWLNRFVVVDDDTVYTLTTAEEPGLSFSKEAPDPALFAEAFVAGNFAALADTGASAAIMMTRV